LPENQVVLAKGGPTSSAEPLVSPSTSEPILSPVGPRASGGLPGETSVGSPPKVNRLDAITYLQQVKQTYMDRPAVYNTFLEIMKDFKTQT
jgi:paired amphipathic helix protein Sin3a